MGGAGKGTISAKKENILAPLEFKLCFLAKYQVNTANCLFSVFYFITVFLAISHHFGKRGQNQFFFVIND